MQFPIFIKLQNQNTKAFKDNLHIESLNLSERSTNALKKYGCNVVSDVDLSELDKIPNIGANSKKKSLNCFKGIGNLNVNV